MGGLFFDTDAQYALNFCTKHLARFNGDARHAFTDDARGTLAGTICEAWRFPIIDTYAGGSTAVAGPGDYPLYNQVTFVYRDSPGQPAGSVGIIGTFHNLYAPEPLSRVVFSGQTTQFWAVSCAVPKRQVHRYRFVVDGKIQNDPINPQVAALPTGKIWSRFFTEACAENLVLEDWEQNILRRLVEQMAPFRTEDGQRFLDQFYSSLDNTGDLEVFEHAYRFDESVGEVSFIDNLLARSEHHRLTDYKICLPLIDGILRQRDPYREPGDMNKEIYNALYNEMATDHVIGWDVAQYGSPLFFLNLLRRHVCTGAFSHPKYGGNAAGAGWGYLERVCGNKNSKYGASAFGWRDSLEPPLGGNPDYLG